MASMNKVILIGNAGKDPVIRSTQGGDKIASMTIATSERWTDKQSGEQREKTEWHSVVVFGKAAEIVEKYVKKGNRVAIEGSLQTRKWQDKDGNDRYTTEIVIKPFGGSVMLLTPKSENGQQGQGSESKQNGSAPPAQSSIGDDEIPF